MTLHLVRSQMVPVEKIQPGDTLILPSRRQVTVERVDEYDDAYVVRWWRPAERGEPGARRPDLDSVGDEHNGRYYGSLRPVPAAHCWEVAR